MQEGQPYQKILAMPPYKRHFRSIKYTIEDDANELLVRLVLLISIIQLYPRSYKFLIVIHQLTNNPLSSLNILQPIKSKLNRILLQTILEATNKEIQNLISLGA